MLYNLAYPVLLMGTKTNQFTRRLKAKLGLAGADMARVTYTPDSYYRVTTWRLRRWDIFLTMTVAPMHAARLSVEKFERIKQVAVRPLKNTQELTFHEKRFEYEGNGIFVRYYGPLDGPKILMLHGWNGHAGMLGNTVSAMVDRGYCVVVPDLPGHGKSDGDRFSFYDLGYAIADIFKDDSFEAIMGHSAGGLIAAIVLHRGLKARCYVPIGSPASLGSVLQSYVDVTQMPKRSFPHIIKYYTKRYGLSPDAVGADLLRDLKVRTLVVHEERDWQVVVSNAHELADAAQDGELFLTKGLTHLNILNAETVHTRIAAFLQEGTEPC